MPFEALEPLFQQFDFTYYNTMTDLPVQRIYPYKIEDGGGNGLVEGGLCFTPDLSMGRVTVVHDVFFIQVTLATCT